MPFIVNTCFGKRMLGCSSLKMETKTLLFFHVVVKKRNNSSGIYIKNS